MRTAEAQSACARPAPRQFTPGEIVVVPDVARPACTISFANTQVELRADADGKVSDIIAGFIGRGPDGRFYTSASTSAEISVWAPDGRLLRNVGAEGRGPGAFARGLKTFLFDRGGRVYIADRNQQWSVLGPALDFQKSMTAGMTGMAPASLALDASGAVVAARQSGASSFSVVDISGQTPQVIRSFGAAPEGYAPARGARRIASGGAGTFWAAAPDGSGWGYELELWNTNGTRLRTLRRSASWFPRSLPASTPGAIPPPEIEVLHHDGTGLLYVVLMVPNKEFRIPVGLSPSDAEKAMSAMIDIHVEVIDANAGVVLASLGPVHPLEARPFVPEGMIQGTRLGYRQSEGPDGLSAVRIVEYKLTGR
ncbi:MAG TPA: hypothetical protein VE967_10600 [Gemmatimonadaceae bacterium]|nr:hypothetical protein [Gemmatimonadaceae bacterium]